jgi:diketogulonate reductase-like aldo/keto reductase
MERLVAGGKIRRWGVSNFDVDDMDELFALAGGSACVTDQVLYSLARRAAEWALLPSCAARRVPLMAYSPVDQGRLLANAKLKRIATEAGVGIAQLALAWTLRRPDVISIPKASAPAHVRDNRAAHDLVLDDALCRALDAAFPPPRKPTRLAML